MADKSCISLENTTQCWSFRSVLVVKKLLASASRIQGLDFQNRRKISQLKGKQQLCLQISLSFKQLTAACMVWNFSSQSVKGIQLNKNLKMHFPVSLSYQ
jgi:hypothetical protein